ncbi:MAG TPA: DUF4349 domain-containing protein [Actinomycetota bacterium]|nr:DUF4349 domain-containing protein [Actinomycetota bacterium]
MSVTDIESEIRLALEEEASRYPFPEDLPQRTLQAAQELGSETKRPRRRRWVYGLAAAAAIPVLFLAGLLATHVTAPRASSTANGAVGLPNLPGHPTAGSATGTNGDVSNINGTLGSINTALGSAPGAPGGTGAAPSSSPAAPAGGFTQSVVRTATLEVRIGKGQFSSAWTQANAVAARYGGLVSTSNAQTANGKLDLGTLTLQIPASNLDAALGALEGLGTMTGLTTSSQDVSGQVASDAAQLSALQAEETEYLQLLPQAKSTADILAIETPLNNVEQQIETLQASQSYLQSQVAMASIQATLSEPGSQPTAPKRAGRFAKAWHQAVTGLAAVLADMLVGAAYLIIPALLALAIWAGVRRFRPRLA